VAHITKRNKMTTHGKQIAQYIQVPIAVVGLACRLPGNNKSPTAPWGFLANGGCADTTPPKSRFNFKGHYDGSGKPKTMRSPGGMFLEIIDPRDFDASFFKISRMEATAIDPQQRPLLEVVYDIHSAALNFKVRINNLLLR
jgi:acyl transferase domain-containing protein